VGMGAWRSGLLRAPAEHRTTLIGILAVSAAAGLIGIVSGVDVSIAVAFVYGSAVFLWLSSPRAPSLSALAAVGRMALTNYLLQSIILGFIFYGYGLGLFGRLDSVTAALIGVALYGAQLLFSLWWFRRFRFGPFEWLWRSLTYGRAVVNAAARSTEVPRL